MNVYFIWLCGSVFDCLSFDGEHLSLAASWRLVTVRERALYNDETTRDKFALPMGKMAKVERNLLVTSRNN